VKARAVVITEVIAARPETTVEEIARLLTTHRIGAVLVVHAEWNWFGLVNHVRCTLT
jgi:CBS domain-containing protein